MAPSAKKPAKQVEATIRLPTQPLSTEPTLSHIPLSATSAYVRRSLHTRRSIVSPGLKPPKWSNSFFLYKNAYQRRAAAWCHLNSQVDLNAVLAYSWTELETPGVKNQFMAWGEMNRHRHYLAFPSLLKQRKIRAPMPKLKAPFSRLIKGARIKLFDVEAFVKRPVEQRRQETVGKGKNKKAPKKPNNAFILYRMAYQERVKIAYGQPQNDVISKACGVSWKMESKRVVERFVQLAEIEKKGFEEAFPEYKKGAKTKNAGGDRAQKIKQESSEDEDVEMEGA